MRATELEPPRLVDSGLLRRAFLFNVLNRLKESVAHQLLSASQASVFIHMKGTHRYLFASKWTNFASSELTISFRSLCDMALQHKFSLGISLVLPTFHNIFQEL